MVTLSNEPSKSAHTPNLSASLGQFPAEGFGVGVGLGLGLGEGQPPPHERQPPPHAVTKEKKRRLSTRKRASGAVLLEAISQTLIAFCTIVIVIVTNS